MKNNSRCLFGEAAVRCFNFRGVSEQQTHPPTRGARLVVTVIYSGMLTHREEKGRRRLQTTGLIAAFCRNSPATVCFSKVDILFPAKAQVSHEQVKGYSVNSIKTARSLKQGGRVRGKLRDASHTQKRVRRQQGWRRIVPLKSVRLQLLLFTSSDASWTTSAPRDPRAQH